MFFSAFNGKRTMGQRKQPKLNAADFGKNVMVGGIVVGHPDDAGWQGSSPDRGDLMPEVLAAFHLVEAIIKADRIEEKGI